MCNIYLCMLIKTILSILNSLVTVYHNRFSITAETIPLSVSWRINQRILITNLKFFAKNNLVRDQIQKITMEWSLRPSESVKGFEEPELLEMKTFVYWTTRL